MSSLKLPFKQSTEEIVRSAAATVLLRQLEFAGAPAQRITELCVAPQYGYTASASSLPVGPRFVRITDLRRGAITWDTVPYCTPPDTESYDLRVGDILVARSGSVGKSFLVNCVPQRSVFASYLIRLRAAPHVLPEYVYWCFQTQQFWTQLLRLRRGSAMSNINGRMLQALSFAVPALPLQQAVCDFMDAVRQRLEGTLVDLPPLPTPLEEQRRIVARICNLASTLAEAEALRSDSEQLTRALAVALAKRHFAAEVPSYRLAEVADIRGGIQKTPARTPSLNPVRYLTVAHVQRNRILTDDARYFEATAEELEAWRLQRGDVLIIEGNGSASQIGRTALFRGEIENCIHQNHVIRIRPVTHRVLPEFVNAFLNSPAGQDAVQAQSRSTSGLRTLSVGRIKDIQIPVPPLGEQQRILDGLQRDAALVVGLVSLKSEVKAELNALLPSILDRAFRGQL